MYEHDTRYTQHLKSLFYHIKEVVNAKIIFYLCYVHFKYILFHLGIGASLIIGNLMRIWVPNVMDMVRIRVASCLVCCRKLNTDKLVDVALGTNHAHDFDLNIDLHSLDVDDVAPPQ